MKKIEFFITDKLTAYEEPTINLFCVTVFYGL